MKILKIFIELILKYLIHRKLIETVEYHSMDLVWLWLGRMWPLRGVWRSPLGGHAAVDGISLLTAFVYA